MRPAARTRRLSGDHTAYCGGARATHNRGMQKPALVVTIDTEEEGLWSDRYRVVGNTCRNVEHLPRLHAIFARLGVRPTYLVDYPVATDATARGILAELASGGASEIGAHLHPWCTPPFLPGGARARVTYPHRLPAAVQQAKLTALCQAIHEGWRVQPTSYRAGRWGFDRSTVPVLERLGFTVDTSVRPLWWDPGPGGPSFRRASTCPYRLDATDACRPGESAVMEVPASSGFVGPLAARLERVAQHVPEAPGLRRVLVRFGLCALLPESNSLPNMRALVDELAARDVPVFNVALHSSSTMAGGTPFARDEGERNRFLARVEGVLEHALGRHAAVPLRLSDVPAYLGALPRT
jgi:hypothetical protein